MQETRQNRIARLLQKELAEQRDKFNTMKAQWQNEKNAIGRVQQLREKIEQDSKKPKHIITVWGTGYRYE